MEGLFILYMDHFRTERRQRQPGNLEKLFSEGNPDDRAAPEETDSQVIERHPYAAAEKPDDVGQRGNSPSAEGNFLPERQEGQACEFKALPAQRNPDNRQAAEQSRSQPQQSADKPAKDKP